MKKDNNKKKVKVSFNCVFELDEDKVVDFQKKFISSFLLNENLVSYSFTCKPTCFDLWTPLR